MQTYISRLYKDNSLTKERWRLEIVHWESGKIMDYTFHKTKKAAKTYCLEQWELKAKRRFDLDI